MGFNVNEILPYVCFCNSFFIDCILELFLCEDILDADKSFAPIIL